jgi:hypothetical protein
MTQNLGTPPPEAERSDSMPGLFSDDLEELLRCTRCKLPYQAVKSTSGLRLTYCSFLCELGDLGFSMAGLEHMERDVSKTGPQPEELAEPTAAD